MDSEHIWNEIRETSWGFLCSFSMFVLAFSYPKINEGEVLICRLCSSFLHGQHRPNSLSSTGGRKSTTLCHSRLYPPVDYVRSTNILVLLVLAAPTSEPIQLCCVVKCTVFGGFFLHVFFMATDMAPRPPPLPSVKVGTNENEGGGTLYTYIRCYSAPLPPPPPTVMFKKEKCRKCLQHHAYSVKRCLFNLLE